MHAFHRTELLVGRKGWARLNKVSVLVVGLGGVGSYAAEAIARSGVRKIGLVDFDDVCLTNINRQLHAFRRTVRLPKVELMDKRVRAINPKAEVVSSYSFYGADTCDKLLEPGWDYVIDAIDNVTAKLHLLETCVRRGVPVVSAMGAGGKLDPSCVQVSDLAHTRIDPFAKVIRKELRRRGITEGITAVWSDEPPVVLDQDVANEFRCICPHGDNGLHSCEDRNMIQGSSSFIPAMFGMAAAGAVVNAVLERELFSERRARRKAGHAKSAPARPASASPTPVGG